MSDHSHAVTDVFAILALSLGGMAVVILFFGVSCDLDDINNRFEAIDNRLDAIEFRLDCPPEHRYVDADGESFCLEETP